MNTSVRLSCIGFLADWAWGRYTILLRFGCIYIFGDGFGVEPIADNTLCDIACLDPIYCLVTDEWENVGLKTIAARRRIVKVGRP